jgi:hypothetical protein
MDYLAKAVEAMGTYEAIMNDDVVVRDVSEAREYARVADSYALISIAESLKILAEVSDTQMEMLAELDEMEKLERPPRAMVFNGVTARAGMAGMGTGEFVEWMKRQS